MSEADLRMQIQVMEINLSLSKQHAESLLGIVDTLTNHLDMLSGAVGVVAAGIEEGRTPDDLADRLRAILLPTQMVVGEMRKMAKELHLDQ